MRWLIEQVHPENGDDALAAAASQAGHEVTLLKPERDIPADRLPAGPALFHGSMQKAAEIQAARPDLSVWLDPPAFECCSYFPKVGEFLFNSTYVMLPLSELIRQKWTVYRWLAKDTKIFVRPKLRAEDLHRDSARFAGLRPLLEESRHVQHPAGGHGRGRGSLKIYWANGALWLTRLAR